MQKLKDWTTSGGILIAYKSAAAWAARNEIVKTEFIKEIQPDTTLQLSYADRRKEYTQNAISGAIFKTEADITHPLCYGYTEKVRFLKPVLRWQNRWM